MSETLPLPGFEPMELSPMSSAEGSPAPTLAWLARVPVWKVSTLDCGESLRVSLASFDRATSSWKTLGLFAAEGSSTFSETLPRSLMWDRRTLYQLPPLVHLTYETVSGSSRPMLPTPTAADASGSGSRNTSSSKAHPGVSLTDWARGDGGKGRRLQQTPVPSDSARLIPSHAAGMNLEAWAKAGGPGLLPSPGASDDRNCADYSDRSRGHSPQLRHLGQGRLSSRFVEWMMGYPPGWTDVAGYDKSEPD